VPDGGLRDDDGEGSAFIVRVRLDPPPFTGAPRLLIRIESLDDRTVQHFTDIEQALAALRQRLSAVAAGRA
jgi:hypothetical protein